MKSEIFRFLYLESISGLSKGDQASKDNYFCFRLLDLRFKYVITSKRPGVVIVLPEKIPIEPDPGNAGEGNWQEKIFLTNPAYLYSKV